ncbi:MAG: peptide chain release factor 3 [Gammaproteobacteria bacterium]|nr:peptide chain release factor 3 [Gammaproteobacteria bacterium]
MSESNDIDLAAEIARRRTFAIISHPDAGKTTITEKLLLLGGAIQVAGTVKARKSGRYARSDWMEIEQSRGISVTSSVMQFEYADHTINLLDTPGHNDFSEDTYRTLTAVDAALMIIDAAKGVEERTIRLLEVCRLRHTPIITFINKLDRESRPPLDLLDEIEKSLGIACTPATWPIGSGKSFVGVFDFARDAVLPYATRKDETSTWLPLAAAEQLPAGIDRDALVDEIELVRGAGFEFNHDDFIAGRQTPVYFGSALHNFGVREALDALVRIAPPPGARQSTTRLVAPDEKTFSGFVFKIQANMDPSHRDRIAFLRVCSGHYENPTRAFHVRLGREVSLQNAVTFMASSRIRSEQAFPGDIIGIHNHGTIQIGDTFTGGETLQFTGIPYFAPELFRRAVLRDPLRMKAMAKGLQEIGEEGAVQVFKPLFNNDLILGAVGMLQFEVVAWRLQHEYRVDSAFEPVDIYTVRWVSSDSAADLAEFRERQATRLATDASGALAYLAPSRAALALVVERWPSLRFHATREHGSAPA